jgi:diguanylate cyclase (GGDEF)-like protein/PAS domain S-box-containing protein
MRKARFLALIVFAGIFLPGVAYGDSNSKDILTPKERLWLTQNQSHIVYALETNYAPFVFIDSNEQPTGLAYDYMRLVESKLGVHFKERRFLSLADIFSKVRSKEIDIVNAVTITPERSSFLLFTNSFISVPNVIVVNKDRQRWMQEKDLFGLRVSLVKSYAVTEYLVNKDLGIAPDIASNDLEALLNVSFGRSDAAVVDLATASYLISKNGITNLRVAGETDFNIKLSMAASIDEPVLRSILQKGLSAITDAQRQEIRNRWINASTQSVFNDWRFWAIVGVVLLISLVIVIWNRTLQYQVKLRTKAEQEALEKSEQKYRMLVESAMVGIYRTDLSGTIHYVNHTLTKMLGYTSPDELIGQKSVIMYKYPNQREAFIQKLSKDHVVSNYELELLDSHSNTLPIIISATLDGDILSGMIIDMSEIKKSQNEINKLSKVIEQIDDTVAITDKLGIITYINQAFCDHTGYTREEVIGQSFRILKSDHYDSEFYKKLWLTVIRGNIFRDTLINRKKNGDLYYENKTITPLKDDKNEIIGFVSTGKDVTADALMNQEMQRIATIDKLTGIYNRHKFEELFTLEAERSRRFSQPLSLIMIDIDHFKAVNDTYGHDIGDEVLKTLTEIVHENIRKIDIFARWGGEEFLVLSPSTDLENIQKLAEKLRSAVERTPFPKVNHITISLGVSTFREDDTFSDFFKRVDQGLYYAKEHGRNQMRFI